MVQFHKKNHPIIMASEGGGNRLRLMCVEKDKDFDEIKFMLSFRSSSSEVSFPTSMEELKQRTRDILQVLDRLQVLYFSFIKDPEIIFFFLTLKIGGRVCLIWNGHRKEQGWFFFQKKGRRKEVEEKRKEKRDFTRT